MTYRTAAEHQRLCALFKKGRVKSTANKCPTLERAFIMGEIIGIVAFAFGLVAVGVGLPL